MGKKNKLNTNSNKGASASKPSNKELEKIANELGYEKTSYRTRNGQVIFKHKKKRWFISFDIGSGNGTGSHHKDGFWKMAKGSPEMLNSKDTREGTYDKYLNKVGD